jgi:ubiquitin-protein ligase
VKVIVLKNFPVQPPILVIMDNVVHKDIAPNEYTYFGAAIKKWTPQSNLVLLLQQITEEFNREPPIPERLLLGQSIPHQANPM